MRGCGVLHSRWKMFQGIESDRMTTDRSSTAMTRGLFIAWLNREVIKDLSKKKFR